MWPTMSVFQGSNRCSTTIHVEIEVAHGNAFQEAKWGDYLAHKYSKVQKKSPW